MMMFACRCLKLSFLLIILNCDNFFNAQGIYKYEVIVDYIDIPDSKKDELCDFGTVRVKKLNRATYAVDGHFDLLRDITDDMEGTYELYTLQGNEYRRTTDKKVLKDLCSQSQEYRHYFTNYFKFTDISPNYNCPFPKGRYHIMNASFPNEILPFDPPRGEKFRVNITVSLGLAELSRFSIYVVLKKHLPISFM